MKLHLPQSDKFACLALFLTVFIHPADDAPLKVFLWFAMYLAAVLLITLALKWHENNE